jgi:uncharacterized protein (DUF924 family)
MIPDPTPKQVLAFWFGGELHEPVSEQRQQQWFKKDSQFDQAIRDQFLSTYGAAAAGELDQWQTSPAGALALAIVLDQFPRNLFRGSAQAFATDAQALVVAQGAIAHGWDYQFPPLQRWPFYMPFEHSEILEHQQRAIELFCQLSQEDPSLNHFLDFARRHHGVIERFGRFPHRNALLGRATTPAEAAFLQQPGSGF